MRKEGKVMKIMKVTNMERKSVKNVKITEPNISFVTCIGTARKK